jgi:hypothetical protein
MLTASPPQRRGVDALAWLVRAAAALAGVLYVLARLGSMPHWAVLIGMALLDAASFGWAVHALRRTTDKPLPARTILRLTVVLVFALAAYALLQFPDAPWSPSGLPFVFGAAFQMFMLLVFLAVAVTVLPRRHQWWFDNAAAAPGAWVSLLLRSDGGAEVGGVDGRLGRFKSEEEAREWLGEHGYIPADRAIREGLVSAAPPDPTAVTRQRERARAASTSPQPRVRVAPEASDGAAHEAANGASDEMDGNAPPGEPEAPRAVAVDDPHDPRT